MLNLRPHKLLIERTSDGGYDANRNPVGAESLWSDPIPCHYDTDSKDRIYMNVDGSYTVFDYAVWLDPIMEDFTVKYVRLIDQFGNIKEERRKVEKCVNGQLRTKLYL